MRVLKQQPGDTHTHTQTPHNWVVLQSSKLFMELMARDCGPCWYGICRSENSKGVSKKKEKKEKEIKYSQYVFTQM